MFAVIKTGGKQYRVSAGDEFTVEKLVAEAGETIQFNQVLMLGGDETTVGAPLVEGAVVNAEVVEQTRGPKVVSFKKRRRKHGSKRLKGHRQHLTMVRITEILADGVQDDARHALISAARGLGFELLDTFLAEEVEPLGILRVVHQPPDVTGARNLRLLGRALGGGEASGVGREEASLELEGAQLAVGQRALAVAVDHTPSILHIAGRARPVEPPGAARSSGLEPTTLRLTVAAAPSAPRATECDGVPETGSFSPPDSRSKRTKSH
ncbi:MAG: 50S ribosomal protein L21 [Proteobacteria bacterium]|nr:50S ribosomal protein L21 [Pseudomonadota bacterium]